MSSIPAVTARKLAAINGDFLVFDNVTKLEFVKELRLKRRKPAVIIKLKDHKPKEPKAKTPRKKKEPTDAKIPETHADEVI